MLVGVNISTTRYFGGGNTVSELRRLYYVAKTEFRAQFAKDKLAAVVVLATFFSFSEGSEVGFSRDIAVGNAALIGAHTAVLTSISLLLIGFFIIRGSIEQDRHGGPGQLIAATPLKSRTYVGGKILGNALLLAVVPCVMIFITIVRFYLRGVGPFDIGMLVTPFVLFVPSTIVLVASIATLFEFVDFLRGTKASVAYFFVVVIVLVSGVADPTGIRPIVTSIEKVSATQTMNGKPLWYGVTLTPSLLINRFLYVGTPLVVVYVSLSRFERFDPTHIEKKDREKPSVVERSVDTLSKPLNSVDLSLSLLVPRYVFTRIFAEGAQTDD